MFFGFMFPELMKLLREHCRSSENLYLERDESCSLPWIILQHMIHLQMYEVCRRSAKREEEKEKKQEERRQVMRNLSQSACALWENQKKRDD